MGCVMKFNKSTLKVALGLSVLASQTGCISALVFPPLIIPGVIFYALGVGEPFERGEGLRFTGVLLGSKDPGHAVALNQIPLDESIAQKAGVSVEDIEDYNNNLNQIRTVALELQQDIRSQLARSELKHYTRMDQLAQDVQVDSLAKKYGFGSGQEFLETMTSQHLSNEKVQSFSEATHLEAAQVKILLHYGFGVKMTR